MATGNSTEVRYMLRYTSGFELQGENILYVASLPSCCWRRLYHLHEIGGKRTSPTVHFAMPPNQRGETADQ